MRIGRVQENDVVLQDPSVSRRHARIFLQQDRYFVEDLGSTSGTAVNGEPLKVARPLKHGDQLKVGTFQFAVALATDAAPGATLLDPLKAPLVVAGMETRIFDPAASVAKTVPIPAAKRASSTGALVPVKSGPPAKRPSQALAPAAPERPAPRSSQALAPAPAERPVPARSSPSEASLSPAERARRKRQFGDSVGGQLRLFWADLPRRTRRIVMGLSGAALLGGGIALYLFFAPASTGPTGPEPDHLTRQPLRDSFGYGDGVTWNRPDMKVFYFDFVSATRAVAVLHYQAKDISDGEVVISLNSADEGKVPADTNDADDREVELVLAPDHLKRGASNQVMFDNVKNPPDKQPWRVWNVSIEIIPIPEMNEEDLLAQAREDAKRGREFLQRKDIGAENLFKAWKSYRNAWITLESLKRKPDLYLEVREQLVKMNRELNHQCSKLMLEFQRQMQFKNPRKARQTLEDVKRFFPTTEHRCHLLALQKMNEYDL